MISLCIFWNLLATQLSKKLLIHKYCHSKSYSKLCTVQNSIFNNWNWLGESEVGYKSIIRFKIILKNQKSQKCKNILNLSLTFLHLLLGIYFHDLMLTFDKTSCFPPMLCLRLKSFKNILGWHWLIILYKLQVYNIIIQYLYSLLHTHTKV